jgi:hypothetical protein
MSFSRILLAAGTVALLAGTSAYAADPSPAAPPAQNDGRGMMRGMFTQEERMMLMADAFKATAGMTDDQRHDYRHQQRERIMAMSDADRAKFKADLDKRWAALTPAQQADIKSKVDAFRAARRGNGGGYGQ